MSLSKIFARLVALIGAGAILIRHRDGTTHAPAWGAEPAIPGAVPQNIPTLKMPTALGWKDGHVPIAAPGLKVNAFAAGLKHPRQVYVLPNGDVLVAESVGQAGPVKTAFDYAMLTTMQRAHAVGESPNRITLLRDADKDGVAEVRETFLSGLNLPFGMALAGDTLYVGNTDSVVTFPYKDGETQITAKGKTVMTMDGGGHWTRNLLLSKDGKKLYVAIGSVSNIGDGGMEIEHERAAIHEFDLETGTSRVFGSGLRNPVGMAIVPDTNTLWTVVNERDGLGDETPPDYLTSVKDGGFYGWPYCYWGQIVDDRVPQDKAMVAKAVQPDYALGGHTASLGLCWMPAGTLPGFPEGVAIGQHGSWNRSKLAGYKVAFVPFANGRPNGPPRDIITGFLAPDERHSYGRPVGVTLGADGSLLVADDVGDVIWRVTGA
jgi:glucose/arabinose dehydrogenase